jgi:hypothetical protein
VDQRIVLTQTVSRDKYVQNASPEFWSVKYVRPLRDCHPHDQIVQRRIAAAWGGLVKGGASHHVCPESLVKPDSRPPRGHLGASPHRWILNFKDHTTSGSRSNIGHHVAEETSANPLIPMVSLYREILKEVDAVIQRQTDSKRNN